MYTTEGKIKEPNLAADIGQGLMGMASSYAKKDMGGLLKGGLGILRAASGGNQKAGEYAKKTRTSPADVVSTCLSGRKHVVTYPVPQISWSGCKDSQTSADTVEAGQATGAMSHVSFFFHHASLVTNPLIFLNTRRSSRSYLKTKT